MKHTFGIKVRVCIGFRSKATPNPAMSMVCHGAVARCLRRLAQTEAAWSGMLALNASRGRGMLAGGAIVTSRAGRREQRQLPSGPMAHGGMRRAYQGGNVVGDESSCNTPYRNSSGGVRLVGAAALGTQRGFWTLAHFGGLVGELRGGRGSGQLSRFTSEAGFLGEEGCTR